MLISKELIIPNFGKVILNPPAPKLRRTKQVKYL